jgi:transcriptional regulator with PAS, ATPase and Fis domain
MKDMKNIYLEINLYVLIISATNKKQEVIFLSKYSFPGNVREFENLIERSVALSSTNIILPALLFVFFVATQAHIKTI